jgi:hypothetical protein
MNAMVGIGAETPVERAPADLEGRLVWLLKFGIPRVSRVRSASGWHASIEMNTNTDGASFEVKSEFNHDTPSQALDLLIRRMLAALAAQGKP